MPGPAYYSAPINLAKNADWIVSIQLKAGTIAIDLTGSIFRLHIRKHENDAEALVSLTSVDNDGIEITDAINGLLTITISRERMNHLATPTDEGAQYVGDLVRLRPDGEQERWWEMSPVSVWQGSTRP